MTLPIIPGATPPAPVAPPVPAPPVPTPPPVPPVVVPPVITPVVPDLDAPLGEPGLRALQAERDLRKQEETARKALEAQLTAYQQRDMTELQVAQAKAADWERKHVELSAVNTRNSIALEFGITGDDLVFLTGTTEDDLRAQATRAKTLIEGRIAATAPPAFVPNPGQAPGTGTPPPVAATVDAGKALYVSRNPKSN